MRFLIDNPLSLFLAVELRHLKQDVIHVTEIGLGAASDDVILQHAIDEARIIVTADNDFPRLLAIRKLTMPSVILFKTGSLFSPPQQLSILKDNLDTLSQPLAQGCIVTIRKQAIRIRLLPIYPSFED